MYRSYKIITTALLISTGLFSNAIAHNVKHDPTEPPTYENTHGNRPNNDINITAIFAGQESQNAMIGGHLFTIGDRISDATIVTINAKGITLKNDDGTISKIPMPSSNVKTPVINKNKVTKNTAKNDGDSLSKIPMPSSTTKTPIINKKETKKNVD